MNDNKFAFPFGAFSDTVDYFICYFIHFDLVSELMMELKHGESASCISQPVCV